jgi:hypothetical protein
MARWRPPHSSALLPGVAQVTWAFTAVRTGWDGISDLPSGNAVR